MAPTPAEIIHKGLLLGLTRWEKVYTEEMDPFDVIGGDEHRGIRIITPEGASVLVITLPEEDY